MAIAPKLRRGGVMSGIVDYLVALHDSGGSDLHLASGVPPIVRVHGILTALDADVLQQENVAALACEILSDEQRSQLLETKNIDFALEIDLGGQLGVWRYRGNAYFQKMVLMWYCVLFPLRCLRWRN